MNLLFCSTESLQMAWEAVIVPGVPSMSISKTMMRRLRILNMSSALRLQAA